MHARWMSDAEWDIVDRVFGSTLPWRRRIFVTDFSGLKDTPFTIPTSALTAIPEVLAGMYLGGSAGGAIYGPAGAVLGGILGGLAGVGVAEVTSVFNVAYLMNVGTAYPDMARFYSALLVHETTHVWQGKNDIFALTYVLSSVKNQLAGMAAGGGYGGRAAAYDYNPLGRPWGAYNAEQQAHLVEDWFGSGEPTSGPLWPYIRDYVRKGIS
jgi:hypothetical protein